MDITAIHIQPLDFPVVAVGASAGGIPALQGLFNAIPAQPNLAFVVVQHLLPDQPSRLSELLSRWAALAVHEAADGVRLQRDCLYVAPPGRWLGLEGGLFVARPFAPGGTRAGIDTIDALFESLARELGPRAIGVVLSGTGADGAAGATRIKQAGGLVFVQDPVTALHDGMPRAVIARAVADRILPLEAMAEELVACASPAYARPGAAAPWTGAVTKTLDAIFGLIRQQAGLDLSGYRLTPLRWRIEQRMGQRRVRTFPDYEALLRDEPAELGALMRGLPVHVTEFFRDAEAWQVLGREVLGPLVQGRRGGPPIRAWTAGCSSGEEAYSVAMLLVEQGGTADPRCGFQVFATDASAEMVTRAGRGVFSPVALKGVSSERRARFFYAADGAWRVKQALRQKMVFAPHDLLADPPFGGLDLVSCRNLLIYFEPKAIERALGLLHSALRVGGYLFLGPAEALGPRQCGFEAVSARWRIYRKAGPACGVKLNFPKRLQSSRQATAVPARALQPVSPEPAEPEGRARGEVARPSHQELAASQEEWQALNEELKAVNEQLNVTNEDLHQKVAELELQGPGVELRRGDDALPGRRAAGALVYARHRRTLSAPGGRCGPVHHRSGPKIRGRTVHPRRAGRDAGGNVAGSRGEERSGPLVSAADSSLPCDPRRDHRGGDHVHRHHGAQGDGTRLTRKPGGTGCAA